MRHALMTVAVLLGFLGISEAQNTPTTMSFDEVKPGMMGMGLTVLKGAAPQQFEFEVIGPQEHWNGLEKVIMVRVFGGPKDTDGRDLLEKTHIMGGMSGSPMYINGKLIGALSMAPEFQMTSKGFVTPIQYMLDMRLALPGVSGALAPFQPGDYYQYCLLWGDEDDCGFATVTAIQGGLAFATGHRLSDIAIGRVQLPVWRSGVLGLLERQSSTVKVGSIATGDIVGTLSYNGLYGSIVVPGTRPASFTTTLRVDSGQTGRIPVTRQYQGVYHPRVAALLTKICAYAAESIIDPQDRAWAVMEARVKVAGIPEPIRIVDHPHTGLASLTSLLSFLIAELDSAQQAPIEWVRVSIGVGHGRPSHVVRHMGLRMKADGNPEYVILARRETDNKFIQLTRTVSVPQPEMLGRHLVWLDGAQIQDWLLKEYNAIDVVPLLNTISERRSLYLVALRPYDRVLKENTTPAGQWQEVSPAVAIYERLDSGVPLILDNESVFSMLVEADEANRGAVKFMLKREKLDEALQ